MLCAVAVAAALVVAGCGDDSNSSGGDQAATSTSQTTTTAADLYENTLPRPRSPGPHPGARVEQLVIRDLRVGEGEEIHSGDTGIFDFISTDWVTGRRVDESWGRDRPFETQIEKNVVIDGWWQGIPGMRVGGRRTIIIPPSLGFKTNPELIDATTYFDIVLLGVRPAQPTGLGGREAPATPPPDAVRTTG